jgi:hypothetical protein
MIDPDILVRPAVTLCLLVYERPALLAAQLARLAQQETEVSWELLIWANTREIQATIETSMRGGVGRNIATHVITSTHNYMGRARNALAELARGRLLLLCDDDIVVGRCFIQDFFSVHRDLGPNVVLCAAGETFHQDGGATYHDFSASACDVHYAHASALAVATETFRRATRVPLPREDYVYIDDLWMSYVWRVHLGIPLRKIHCDGTPHPASRDRTALHRLPKVQALRRAFLATHGETLCTMRVG